MLKYGDKFYAFFGASFDLIFSTSLVPIWKALVITLSGTSGVAVNSVAAIDCVPGSWLLKAPRMAAGSSPLFFWKWTRPRGKTKTSPFLMVLETSTFEAVMKPTSNTPAKTKAISVARGWVWGGFRPPGAMSTRDSDTPSVLRPEIFCTLAAVTTDPIKLLGTPSLARPSKKKSDALIFAASLHAYPFSFVPVCIHITLITNYPFTINIYQKTEYEVARIVCKPLTRGKICYTDILKKVGIWSKSTGDGSKDEKIGEKGLHLLWNQIGWRAVNCYRFECKKELHSCVFISSVLRPVSIDSREPNDN